MMVHEGKRCRRRQRDGAIRGPTGGSRGGSGIQHKSDEGIAAIAFGAWSKFEHARHDESPRLPGRRLLAGAGHNHIGGARRRIIEGAKALAFDHHGPGGETVATRSTFLFSDHKAREADTAASEAAKFLRVVQAPVSDGAEEFSEREVGDALGGGRESRSRRGGLKRGEGEFRLGGVASPREGFGCGSGAARGAGGGFGERLQGRDGREPKAEQVAHNH